MHKAFTPHEYYYYGLQQHLHFLKPCEAIWARHFSEKGYQGQHLQILLKKTQTHTHLYFSPSAPCQVLCPLGIFFRHTSFMQSSFGNFLAAPKFHASAFGTLPTFMPFGNFFVTSKFHASFVPSTACLATCKPLCLRHPRALQNLALQHASLVPQSNSARVPQQLSCTWDVLASVGSTEIFLAQEIAGLLFDPKFGFSQILASSFYLVGRGVGLKFEIFWFVLMGWRWPYPS